GPELEYAVVPAGPLGAADGTAAGEGRYLMASALLGGYAKELGYESAEEALAAREERTFAGRELEHVAYRPLWTVYSADRAQWGNENAWLVIVADYDSTDDGTGVVHQATAYIEADDQVQAQQGNLVVVYVVEYATRMDLFVAT